MIEYVMSVVCREIESRSILTKTGIPGSDYCLNPYVGCAHGCRYCYATFMKKYTGHAEQWGTFVDVKKNAPDLLRKQMKKVKKSSIIISSVTDPYQPIEAKYQLTRKCLTILLEYECAINILTKSPLVLRDMDLIKKFRDIEVGITITTNDEKIRKIFEPNAPPIGARIHTLRKLHEQEVRPYVFVGPLLPMNPNELSKQVRPYIQYAYISKMNYISKTKYIYRKMNIEHWLEPDFLEGTKRELRSYLNGKMTEENLFA
jgi:DNA repair photolyase